MGAVTNTAISEESNTSASSNSANANAVDASKIHTITQEQLKKQRAFERHNERLRKARQLRWKSPGANAKIEDFVLIAQDIKNMADSLREINYEFFLFTKTLVQSGVITLEQLEATRVYEKQREEKFNELRSNETMSREEKIALAKQYDLPLEQLGLTETAEENGQQPENI